MVSAQSSPALQRSDQLDCCAGAEQHGAEIQAIIPVINDLVGLVHERLEESGRSRERYEKGMEELVGAVRELQMKSPVPGGALGSVGEDLER